MDSATRRTLAIVVVSVSLLALAACGSSGTKVCNFAGCCGVGSDACPAQRYVAGTGIDGKVTVFPVVLGTGGLGTPTSVPGPAMTFGMATLNNQFLYASDPELPSLSGLSQIDAWSINGGGTLTSLPGSPFAVTSPSVASGIAVDASRQVLYIADAGKIDAFKADATGALSAISGSPFPAATNSFLTIDPGDHFIFASDFTPPGNVLAFTIDPSTSALTPVPGSPFATIPNFVGNTHPAEIAVDSTGKFVYVALTLTNQVAAFSIVAPGGALNPVPGSPFTAGNGPFALTTVNNFLYVSNLMDATTSGYTIDPTTGALTPMAGSPFAIPAGAFTTDFGAFLYVTGPTGIQTFKIDGTTGALTPVGNPVPYAGATVLTYIQ